MTSSHLVKIIPAHISWKIEYLYMYLGSENFTFSNPVLGTILVNTHFTDSIVRASG
jgi:hypothetical protein